MTTWIALLQGVNIGRTKRIAMADLRAIIAAAGGHDVATHVNSGNAVFRMDGDEATIAADLQARVSDHVGVVVPVVVREAEAWAEIVAANPFPQADTAPTTVHLQCHPRRIDADAVEAILATTPAGDDEAIVIGRELWLHLPDGVKGARINLRALGLAASNPGTSRNWKTVKALQALAMRQSG